MNCYFTGRSPILADEMGLGKTIQTIGMLQFLFTTLNCRYVQREREREREREEEKRTERERERNNNSNNQSKVVLFWLSLL